MQRPIIGFARDELGDWTARLDCGHRQHVRHDPPFVNRPWVLTPEGRASRIGERLDCVRCDRLELPDDVTPVSRTPEFTEDTIPPALRSDHTTAAGIWGRIVVVAGSLRYRCDRLGVDTHLTPEQPGVVVPQVPHAVEPAGPVRFFVELLRPPGEPASPPRASGC